MIELDDRVKALEAWATADQLASTVALNAALSKAQGEFPTIARSHSATIKTKSGGEYAYDYAPLEAIWPAIRDVLATNGLAVLQWLEPGPALRTEIRHAEGGVIGSSFPFQPAETMQALGSQITYLRRYTLVAALGLVTEHDDDGQVASSDEAAAGSVGSAAASSGEGITAAQQRKIGVLLKECEEASPTHEGQQSYVEQLRSNFGVRSRKDLTKKQAGEAIEWLEQQKEAAAIPFG